MLFDIVILITGLVVLILGGDFLVRGASGIALQFRISPLVIGLTVVAFGTSAPELLISIKAALSGSPDMTMGNIVGSNICNLGLVLGITTLISKIKVNIDSIRIDWPVTMGSSLLLYFLVKEENSMISRYEGVFFVLLIIIYTIFIIKRSRKNALVGLRFDDDLPKGNHSNYRDWIIIGIGSLGLYFGSEWFVNGAKSIAEGMGVSHRVIGITVLALGTSLPELVTAIVAAIKMETDLALGNLMGSNIFNILSILGITSIITEIEVSKEILNNDMIPMLGLTLLLLPLMIIGKKMGKVAGVILLSFYFVYTYTVVL